jgi:diguanylate cyclase (GGDEF)-like protein
MAQLVFIDGRRMGQTVVLGSRNTLGRSPENSIVLSEPGITGFHAALTVEGGAWRIEAADPSAALAVNGRACRRQAVRHGDTLSLGDLTLLFSEEAPSPSPDFLRRPGTETPPSLVESRVRHFTDAGATVAALREGPRGGGPLEALVHVAEAVAKLKLSDLVEALLDNLFSALKPDRCFVLLFDDQGALQVQGERTSPASRLTGSVKVSRTILNDALAKREGVLTRSALQDARFASGESVQDQNIQTAMSAPMIAGERIQGILHVDRITPDGPYGEDDLKLLMAIARQAAVAVENVRAHEEVVAYGRALRRLEAGSRRMIASLSEEVVLREAVEQACRIFDATKASLLLLDPSGGFLTVAESNCIDRKVWPSVRIRPGEGYAGKVFADGKAFLVRERPEPPVRPYETASFVIAPVISRAEGLEGEARPIGVLSVTDKAARSPFGPIDQELLAVFAAQVGTALQNARLHERATVDALTRLHTRQFFDFRFEEEVRAHPALSLLMVDLDHFKDKNDVYGHPVGDVILAEAARLLKERVALPGFAARYGGEEFVAVLPGVGPERALDLAKDLRLAVEEFAFNAGSEPLRCTVSVGVAAARPGDTPESLLKRADTALYMAKRAGRNRVELFKGNP